MTAWKKARGLLGPLAPLLGEWAAGSRKGREERRRQGCELATGS
jgi:hypothetical protein